MGIDQVGHHATFLVRDCGKYARNIAMEDHRLFVGPQARSPDFYDLQCRITAWTITCE
jgi:hypothetical protein